VWGLLDKASERGRSFKEKLSESEGFGLTRWFDGVASSAKPICLSLAMATGASGCSTINFVANHDQLREDARLIEQMPPQSIAELAEQRVAENPEGLPTLSVQELSQAIVKNRYNVNLGSGIALENPYVPGQSVLVVESGDVPAHLKLLADTGLNPSALVSTSSGSHAFAINTNLPQIDFSASRPGLHEQQKTSVIMLGDKLIPATWSYGEQPEQDIANALYHELAHVHTTVEMAALLSSDSALDTLTASYREVIEAHAQTTAAIMTGKAYGLSTQQFRNMLATESELSTALYLNGEALGGVLTADPDSNSDNYRPQKALEVLDEMIERDPDLLQKVDESLVPVLAMDIVRQAGYYHNKAETILEETMDRLPAHAIPAAEKADVYLQEQLKNAFPDNDVFNTRMQTLIDAWRAHKEFAFLERIGWKLERGLEDYPVQEVWETADDAGRVFESVTPDLTALVEHQSQRIRSGDVDRGGALREVITGIKELAEQRPNLDEMDVQRSELLADIKDELMAIHQGRVVGDSNAAAAQGSGDGPEQIALELLERYDLGRFDVDGSLSLAPAQ